MPFQPPLSKLPADRLHRSGYPFAFSDRQNILQVLYDNLKDKSKILLGKNLTTVRQRTSGVTVICDDGTSYLGDILAGADGVNSKARSEMWRLADEVDSELVKNDKSCKQHSKHVADTANHHRSSREPVSMSLRHRLFVLRFAGRRDRHRLRRKAQHFDHRWQE
jgi:2-polyprenyl-6-methoxyphenol hydroxylase-like FAD-dependent oxidoreductase